MATDVTSMWPEMTAKKTGWRGQEKAIHSHPEAETDNVES